MASEKKEKKEKEITKAAPLSLALQHKRVKTAEGKIRSIKKQVK